MPAARSRTAATTAQPPLRGGRAARPGMISAGALGLALAMSAVGCAHRGQAQVKVDQLNRTIASLRAQNAEYAKQVEELENRVFILTDRLDSRRVNAEKVAAPELPSITLRPGRPAAEAEAPAVEAPAPPGTLSDPDVEYAGEAAKTNTKRPLLRLYGDETPLLTPRESERGQDQPVLISGDERVRGPSPRKAARAAINPVDVYRRAQDALRSQRHDEATIGFREFVRQFPDHELADNAQYWLGECAYDQKDYPAAARAFRLVAERYPAGNKVPDALLKMAFSYLAAGTVDPGRQALQQVVRSYPQHEAADLARARLQELERGGGNGAPSPRGSAVRPGEEGP